jgi:nucleoside-diphosphate-sugar epimerase
MKTIAVTGSSGFIGRHLLWSLREQQYNIIEIDIEKDLDISDWSKARNIPHFDTIIHLAAKTFVPDSFKRPHEFYFANQSCTLNVLELARIYSANVIYFSSYLYGMPEYLPIDEKHPLKPHNPYAQSKIICEKICEGYQRDFGVPVIIFRPFNIYGPGQNSSFLIPNIIEQLKSGEILLKDPRPKRDFIHVSDIVYAVMLAIKLENPGLQTFNLGTGLSFSVEEIVNLIIKYFGKRTIVKYANEYRPGEVLDTIADIRKINTVLKWSPYINIEKGLEALLEKV